VWKLLVGGDLRAGSQGHFSATEQASQGELPRDRGRRHARGALRMASRATQIQPPGWALDFLAYVDDDWDRSEVAIAGEAKLLQKDALKLSASLEVCGGRGRHDEADCTELKNHHRKYLGLLKYRPSILWIVGPGAFTAADPDLLFRVEEDSGSIVRLRPIDARELTFSSP
jgi:hypothetical protein